MLPKPTPRPKFSVTSDGVVLNLWGSNPTPNITANRTLVPKQDDTGNADGVKEHKNNSNSKQKCASSSRKRIRPTGWPKK